VRLASCCHPAPPRVTRSGKARIIRRRQVVQQWLDHTVAEADLLETRLRERSSFKSSLALRADAGLVTR